MQYSYFLLLSLLSTLFFQFTYFIYQYIFFFVIFIFPHSFFLFFAAGKLYFLCTDEINKHQMQNNNSQKSIYFTTDNSLIYTAFFADFGPMDLGITFSFCQSLIDTMKNANKEKKIVYYYCASHPHRRANAAVLLCAYLVSTVRANIRYRYKCFVLFCLSFFCFSFLFLPSYMLIL